MLKKSIVIFIILTIIIGIIGFIRSNQNKVHIVSNDLQVLSQKLNVNPPGNKNLDHIVIIVMENTAYGDIVGNQNVPYINNLVKSGSLAKNYQAITHPSLPNYLALIGGSTFGITSDCTDCYINSANLVDQLESLHITWKAYMESMPSPCFIGSKGQYAQKHNPFIYFDDIRKNSDRCNNIVPYDELVTDLQTTSTTPNYIFISPNLCHDMHDCGVKVGDTWLSNQVPLILQSPAFKNQNSLLVLTWDEDNGSDKNHIATLFIGKNVKPGYISEKSYTHYSLLRMIEQNWNLPSLTTNDAQAENILDIFN